MSAASGVGVLLRSLKLPGFVRAYSEVAEQAEREGWGFERYLLHLAEIEVEDRRCHRIERLLRQSGLPHEKTSPPSSCRGCQPRCAEAYRLCAREAS